MKLNRRVLYALLLAGASGLSACDRTDGLVDVTGPVAAPQYELEATTDAAGGRKRVEFLSRTNALTGDVTYATTEPVGKWGAVLTFGEHKLVVPRDAVNRATYFSATLRAGSEIRIDMRAWDDRGAVTQFNRPVQLTFSLADASTADLSAVAVFYLNPNGLVEQMPSYTDQGARSVTGYLNHFSDYIPGTMRNDTTTTQP